MARRQAESGHSLLDLLFVLGTMGTLGGMAVPPLLTALDDYRTAGAVRYLSTRIQRARMEALTRSTNVAMQFVQSGYSVYMDGNGDGVRTADIRRAIDPRIGAFERLSDNFSGVEFALLPGLPPIEAGNPPPGSDAIKLGSGNLLSYSSTGSSSSGSLYIRGRSGAQYVIRVLGDTGRTRILRFDVRTRQWKPL